jgi:hypothetical protein
MKELIEKVSKNVHDSSKLWIEFTKDLKHYLENGDLDLYLINGISPNLFKWAENSPQNIKQLEILEKDKESIFYKTLLKTNDYGPIGIFLQNNIQLDRVQHTWSIYNLVNALNLDLNKDEIIFEFGGGTGQMADVLSDLNFKGKHIVYDLPLITVLQKYFVDKRNIKNVHILDDETQNLMNSTNYLPCNQPNSEKTILGLPNINFIATYSLSETDVCTRDKFAEYMTHFSRIYIVYWPGKTDAEDYIDNAEYIQIIKQNIENTHYYYDGDNFGNGKVFMAIKKEFGNCERCR